AAQCSVPSVARRNLMPDPSEQSGLEGGLDAQPKAARRSTGRLMAGLPGGPAVLLVAAGAVLLAVFLWFASRPPVVEVATIRPRTVEVAMSVVGRVRPIELVDVRSPNPGQVVRLYQDEGDVVEAGAPLAVVRSEAERAQTDAFRARETAAGAEAERARLAYDRTRTLADKGFASGAALDNARAALRAAEPPLAAAAA